MNTDKTTSKAGATAEVAQVMVERDCTFEFKGKTFQSGGAFVSPSHIVAYPRANGVLGDWHGNPIGTWRIVATWTLPRTCYISDKMHQIEAVVNGKTYTGRGAGEEMIYRGKLKK